MPAPQLRQRRVAHLDGERAQTRMLEARRKEDAARPHHPASAWRRAREREHVIPGSGRGDGGNEALIQPTSPRSQARGRACRPFRAFRAKQHGCSDVTTYNGVHTHGTADPHP